MGESVYCNPHEMASKMTTKDFFASGTPTQFDFALTLYDRALRLKAESKSSKPENVIKLDKWYQNELPKKIKSRGKDAHLVHDELVQTIKWKLARGKFRPNLVNLVQMNTPRVVMQETKKAFRKLQKTNDLQSAANSLCNLKGVGPAMASAVLAAGAPHIAPFMADECLLAMPDVDSLDYTMKEYMRFVEYVKACVERLNSQGGTNWTPHKVETAVWTHYIVRDLKPDILVDMPEAEPVAAAPPATASSVVSEAVTEADSEPKNGQVTATPVATGSADEEDTKSSMTSSMGDEDSNSRPAVDTKVNYSTAEENIVTTEPSDAIPIPAQKEEEAAKNGNTEAAALEQVQVPAPQAPTPKTNGNNSHSSNGSELVAAAPAAEAPVAAVVDDPNPAATAVPAPVAKEEQQNGDRTGSGNANEEDKAKASEQTQPNGELENGIISSEKESTDLRSSSPAASSLKRSAEEAAETPVVNPEAAAVPAEAKAAAASNAEPAAKKLKTCEEQAEEAGAANQAPQVAV